MVRGASGLNIILGIWLIISPWVLGYSGLPWPLWNNVVCGILIALLAAARIWSPGTGPG
ncbi:MAG: SPW repeat protein, partial [Acetobacteraceae bacterium]|nr:SPW repeat protein [Acetobacteraceae bacterium]